MKTSQARIIPHLTWALFAAAPAFAAPGGELDPTFGENGRVSLALGSNGLGYAGAQQADGKLVIAGSLESDAFDFAVLRLNADGTLDTTFAPNATVPGVATVDFGGAGGFGGDDAYAMALQPDGKIVAAGATEVTEGVFDVALTRFNADGSIDTGFGTDGRATLDLGGTDEFAAGVVLLQDGRIVVAGTSNAGTDYDVLFARFNANGTLDATFGTNGSVLVDTNGENNEAFWLTQQADGKLIACGVVAPEPFNSLNGKMHAVRVNADGTVDTAFGVAGVANIDTGTPLGDASTCKAMPDGTLIIAGSSGAQGAADLALARLTANGVLDATFGSGGLTSADLGKSEIVQAMVLLSDGKIGVTGVTEDVAAGQPRDNYVARFNPDGSLDTTFGNNGATITDFGGASEGLALVEQADGKLVTIGAANEVGTFAIARVDTAGTGNVGVVGFAESAANISEGTANLVLTVRRTGGSVGAVDVDVSFVDGTAKSPGDYTANTTALSWSSGEMTDKTITIPIVNDNAAEDPEIFHVTLSNSTTAGLALSRADVSVQIADDDAPPPPPPPPPPASGNGGGGTTGLELLALLALLNFRRRVHAVA